MSFFPTIIFTTCSRIHKYYFICAFVFSAWNNQNIHIRVNYTNVISDSWNFSSSLSSSFINIEAKENPIYTAIIIWYGKNERRIEKKTGKAKTKKLFKFLLLRQTISISILNTSLPFNYGCCCCRFFLLIDWKKYKKITTIIWYVNCTFSYIKLILKLSVSYHKHTHTYWTNKYKIKQTR